MRTHSLLLTASLLLASTTWTGCATHRGPAGSGARYGVNRVTLPSDLRPGDSVDILFEDGGLASARVIAWDAGAIVVELDGERETVPWREVAAVREPRAPRAPREPTPGSAMRRFFLLMGAIALAASGID